MLTDYLFRSLTSKIIKKQILIRSKQMSVINLHLEDIKEFQIPLPPLPEQRRIAEILTAADQRIEKEETYRDKLLQLKKVLMQDLLTGKVRI
ncbi:MAG TPA: restriction endonuclease subunit S [Methanosarcinaceae archaeon]|nr:restriction endonuclease subunit S [Methanosarcinaceae archaeon]